MPSVVSDNPAQWRQYRRLRNLWLVSFLAGLPAFILIGVPLSWAWGSEVPAALVAILFMLGLMGGGVGMALWHCPHCSKVFHLKGSMRNPFARRRMHCGLPKREPRC
jgi:hypothetical protein